MIIKILQSSHTFEAVKYNERKVSEGVAELLEVKNFQHLQELGMLEAKAEFGILNSMQPYLQKMMNVVSMNLWKQLINILTKWDMVMKNNPS